MRLMAFLLLSSLAFAGEPIFPVTGRYLEQKAPVLVKPSLLGVTPWYVNGHQTPDSHLIQTHGADPKLVSQLTPEEKNRLHGVYHSRIQVQAQSGCPGGRCPLRRSR